MTNPVRAPKKPKNQPRPFHEAMAPGLPLNPAAAMKEPGLSDRQIRMGLTIIWILVMVLAGGALGLRLLAAQPESDVPGVPVAAATVNVVPLSPALPIVPSVPASYPQLSVVPAASVTQAQAGNPFKVIAGVVYQPTDGVNALLPGYQTQMHVQGTTGTSPSL